MATQTADQKQFRPFLDEDKDYILAPTSVKRMRALDWLRIRAAMTSDEARRRLAKEHCLPIEENEGGQITKVDGEEVPTVSKGAFYEKAAEIVFLGAPDDASKKDVDLGVVREAMGKFDLAGSELASELASGLAALNGSPTPESQTTTT